MYKLWLPQKNLGLESDYRMNWNVITVYQKVEKNALLFHVYEWL
jgi:hypothetical protein